MLASPVRGWKKQDTYTDSCGYDAIPFWIIPMSFMQGAVSDVRHGCQADGSSRWGGLPRGGSGAEFHYL
ncbi:hypothetical protein FT722_22590 [Shigella flexneri]|uniref:Uncharacterized protein n=1 Tax=Shigella flexneri serotype 5a (strain M90T) TaxID=1086030 RepID=A0A4P7TJB3_SHIFM|nr:hypothetical protein B7485_04175 [Shigella flexneri 1c]EEW2891771.1 hypothetical protein [Escherichia coli]EFP9220391.1 hypothetical protein [Shigella flexneri]EFW6584700.1 hypothetical protein [Shigella sonnei]EFX6401258.1 hypothetical protein [Shigella boydii]QCC30722.1 hypothetical protein EKN05_002220 [Shigella flexneri 5a str. M90T]